MRLYKVIFLLCVYLVAVPAWAKLAPEVREAVTMALAPATPHAGLETAQEPLQISKLHGWVVLEVGAIPAEKAYWFITNQDYEYRNTVIDLANERMKTRRGKVYTYLDAGQVMIVAGVKHAGNKVIVRLLSHDVFDPPGRKEEHPSRVAASLEFRVPKALRGDAPALLNKITSWIRPFNSLEDARAHAKTLHESSTR